MITELKSLITNQEWLSQHKALKLSKDLTIDNPTNWADNAVYSLKYFEDSTVPMSGFIVIDIPDGLKFD